MIRSLGPLTNTNHYTKGDKYLDLARDLKKKLWNMKGTMIPTVQSLGIARYNHQGNGLGTGGLGNKRTCGDYSDYSIFKIDQKSEKSPGDLRRLAVTQTPVKDHHLTLV